MQKKIHRTCNQCGLEKRTTVDETEMKIYYCEDCLKEVGAEAIKETSPLRGFIIIGVVAIITFSLGLLLGYKLWA